MSKHNGRAVESVVEWQAKLRAAFMAELTGDDVRQIVRAQIDAAKEGNQAAARLVLSYGVGSPSVPIELPPEPTRAKWAEPVVPPKPERLPSNATVAADIKQIRDSRIATLANRHERGMRLEPEPTPEEEVETEPPPPSSHRNGHSPTSRLN